MQLTSRIATATLKGSQTDGLSVTTTAVESIVTATVVATAAVPTRVARASTPSGT